MSPVNNQLIKKEQFLPFIFVTALFLFWGIPNNLNDVLIRQFMKSFEINRFQAGLVQSAFYMGYFLFAFPAGLVMQKYGYKTGLLIGLFLYSTGTLLFLPAALIGKYSFFLLALFIIASGLSFLETGANPFIAGLGSQETSARRLNLSQSFNPLGAVLGVIIGTLFIFSGVELSSGKVNVLKAAGTYQDYLKEETLRVVMPYIILGLLVFLWGILIFFTRFPEVDNKADYKTRKKGKIKDLLKYPHFLKGVFAQFCYVGAQVGTWSYYIQYIQDYTHQGEKLAGYLLTGTLIVFGIGRFTSTFLMRYYKPDKLMSIYSIINLALVLICIVFPGWTGVGTIFLTSFFMSLMFPTIFALGIKGLGENSKLGGSFMVMSIIGGAVFTPLMGIICMYANSMAIAMTVPMVCYFVIAWYALKGAACEPDIIEENTSLVISH